jgi:hypothetical protein
MFEKYNSASSFEFDAIRKEIADYIESKLSSRELKYIKDVVDSLHASDLAKSFKQEDEIPVNERRINEDEDEDEVPLTKDVKRYIDGQIKNAKKLRKPEKLKKYLTNPAVLGSSSFLHLILLAFEDKYPDAIDVTDEVKKYILSQIPR